MSRASLVMLLVLFASSSTFCFQIGVPSNLYALYHAAVQLKQKNELGVYLINLTVSDLLYLASLPLWLQYIFQVNNSATFLLSDQSVFWPL